MNWDDLRFFSALADSKTVSAAAKKLGVNYVTVSRRIDKLEEALTKTLFERSLDGYKLTVEGEALYQKVVPIQESMEELSQEFDPLHRYKRSVKLSVVPSLAEYLVTPHLLELQQRYQELRLHIDVSLRNLSVVKREADLALRLSLPETGECVAKKMADLNYYLYGTESWIARYQAGEDVATISYDTHLSHLPEAQYIQQHFGSQSIKFSSNSVTVQKKAAETGYGLAVLPACVMSGSELACVSLQQPIRRELWLLVRKNISQSTSVRLVMDSLTSLFEARASEL